MLAELLTHEKCFCLPHGFRVFFFSFFKSYSLSVWLNCTAASWSCFYYRILLWGCLSSCEARSRKNSSGLSTFMISIKMDIFLKRYVFFQFGRHKHEKCPSFKNLCWVSGLGEFLTIFMQDIPYNWNPVSQMKIKYLLYNLSVWYFGTVENRAVKLCHHHRGYC